MPAVGRDEIVCRNCGLTFEVAIQLFPACEACRRTFTEKEKDNAVCDDCYRMYPQTTPRQAVVVSLVGERRVRLCNSCSAVVPRSQMASDSPKPSSPPLERSGVVVSRSGSEPERVVGTPEQIAEYFASLICNITNQLMDDLGKNPGVAQERVRQLGYLFESAVFVW